MFISNPGNSMLIWKILVIKQLSHRWFETYDTHLTSRQAKDHRRGNTEDETLLLKQSMFEIFCWEKNVLKLIANIATD